MFIEIILYLGYFCLIICNCYGGNYINTHNDSRMERQLFNMYPPGEKVVWFFHLLVL
jgi:hypothetical protein